jgi:putative ABC transport system permease protein
MGGGHVTEIWRKLAALRHRDHIAAELEEEMRLHIEMRTAATGDESAARRNFGNITLLAEQSREAWGWPRLENWIRDVRHGFRLVAKRPGFSATVVLTLAIGIGATTTIFSLVNAVLLRPLSYPNSDRLMSLHETRLSADGLISRVAPSRLEDWQHRTRTFEALAGADEETFAETTGLVPEQVHVASVSPRFFAVLGVPPIQGRIFTAEEERSGGPKTIVISEGLWQRRFAGGHAIGGNLRLEGQSYVIVGVMPRSVQYPSSAVDAWFSTQGNAELMRDRGASARFYEAVGRLRSDATIAHAKSDLNAVQTALGETYPKTDARWGVSIEPLKERLVGKVRPTLWLLFGSVSLLLVIACANVGCLLLAQFGSRIEELATRCALGAARATIARQLLAEGQVYAVLGGALGIFLAYVSVGFVRQQLPDLPRVSETVVDVKVLAFAAAVSVAAAVVFSLAPLVRLVKRDLAMSLIRGGRGVVGSGQRVTKLLVSAQLAFATVLLVGAGLFLRSLLVLQETSLGFEPDHVLALRISASFNELPEAVVQRHQRTMDALSALPNVRAVAMSRGLPGAIAAPTVEFRLVGDAVDQTGAHFARRRIVTARYFQSVGIPVLAGETCRMDPSRHEEYQALVNKAFADRYGSEHDPIGREIVLGPQESSSAVKIVGVVGNAREGGYEDGYSQPVQPIVYSCGFLRWLPDSDFLIRTGGQPAMLARAAREAIHEIEPNRAVYSVQPLTDALSDTLSQNRFRTLLVSAFSVIALMLAAIGLYGVMTYMVSLRTREFGIRLAFGASPPMIAVEILRSACVLAIVGGAVGLTLAAATSRVLGALISGVRPTDPLAYAWAAGVLLGAALIACLNPGLRAMSVNPIEALRG